MKKRLLSVLLVLVMVLSMIPVSVSAEGAHTPGTHTAAHQCEKCGANATWSAWESTNSLPTSGHYYLTGDVTVSAQTVLSGNLCLCLNGYTITGAQNNKTIAVATANLTLTITDCTAVEIDGVYYAGKLSGGKNTTSNGGYIYLGNNGQKLYFYDGIIENNRAYAGGGAIWVANGSSTSKCGSVFMYGGELRNNVAADASNAGKAGGAVNLGNYGKFYMTGGKITGNEAKRGGGIYAGTNATVVVKNASVTGNHASELAGGIYMDSGTLALQEEAIITGNTGADQVASNLFLTSAATGAVANTLKGNAKIGVTLAEPRISAGNMAVTTAATGTDANFFESDNAAYQPKLEGNQVILAEKTEPTPPPVVQSHTHNGCGDAACADHAAITYEKWTDPNTLPTSGSYYLNTDVTLSNQTIMTGNLDLCLNGKTVTGPSNNRIITTGMNAYTLTISDCTAKVEGDVYTAGKLTGAVKASTKSSDTGGAIYIYSGATFYLFDGIIENNQAHQGGGAVHVGGTMYMENGVIRNNKAGKDGAWKAGGGINMGTDSKLYITGGEISGNEAKLGGGIYVHATGTVEITDTVITGNKIAAGSNGTGAGVYAPGGSVKLAGETKIIGNQTENLYLDTNMAGVDANELAGTAKIGVTLSAGRKTKSMNITTGRTADVAKYFESDDVTLVVTQDAEVYLKSAFSHNHCVCGETGCTEHAQVEYLAWTDATKLPTSGNYCLQTDVTLTTQTIMDGDLKLCLHGKTVTGPSDNRIITTGMNAFTLTISDCTAKVEDGAYKAGKLTGAVKASTKSSDTGGAIYIYSGATLYLFDGIIENNQAHQGGGAIHVGGTMYMENGVIRNNKAGKDDAWKAGGGINMGTNSKLYITGGEISGNEAKLGGGIYVHATGTVEITDTVITGNKIAAGSNGTGAGVYAPGGSVKLAGETKIIGNQTENLYLDTNMAGVDANELAGTAKIGVTLSAGRKTKSMNITTGRTADVAKYFESDDVTLVVTQDAEVYLKSAFSHNHCVCGETGCTEHAQVEYLAWTDATKLPTSGNYCLQTDVQLSAQTVLTGSLNLCLNGKTVIGFEGNRILASVGGHTLTISDCTAKTENGIYTAGKLTGAVHNAKSNNSGGAIYVGNNDTLYLYDGILTGNHAYGGGGALSVGGTMYMYGGEISGNSALGAGDGREGGAIYINKTGKAYLYGGTICGNEARVGGGIYCLGTVLEIADTKIENNKATSVAGAIFLSDDAAIKLSGNLRILGNTAAGKASNLVIPDKLTLAVGTMGPDAKVAVSASAFRYISGETADCSAAFQSDAATLSVIYKDGKLYMDAADGHKHCLCNGATQGCEHTAVKWAAWESANSLPTSGNYYLTCDVTVNGQTGLDSTELNLCLNGYTIKTTKGRVFYTKGDTKLNITDCTAEGAITGADLSAIMTENKETSKPVVSIYGGSFRENSTNALGGAIVAQGSATVNIYGGVFAKNSSIGKLKLDENGEPLLDDKGNQQADNAIGGAAIGMYGENTVLNVYGGTFKDNETSHVECKQANGSISNKGGYGIIYIKGQANVKGGTFTGGKALLGGAFFVTGEKAVLTIDNAVITENYAKGGGAILLQSGATVNLKNAEITGNTCGGAGGGAIYISGKSVLNLQGGTIRDNTSPGNGGALYVSEGTANLLGGEISGNKADVNGAGVFVNRATAIFGGTTVKNNAAKNNGGGIYGAGATLIQIDKSEITGNTAKNGAGIYATQNVVGDTTLYSTVVMNAGAVISGNKAETNCGGLMMVGKGSVLTMNGGAVSGNTAKNGGGILVQTGATMHFVDGKITGNQATVGGGGLYISANSTLNMQGGTISGNDATNNGGGLLIQRGYGKFNGGTISGNTATTAAGVYFAGAKADIYNVTIVGNTSRKNCGGVMLGANDYTLSGVKYTAVPLVNMYGGTISGNRAPAANAGGVLLQSKGSTLNLHGGSIFDNTCAVGGGGIYASTNSVFNMDGGEISGNEAKTGGAIHCQRGFVTITGGQINNNKATNSGGAIYVTGNTSTPAIEFYNETIRSGIVTLKNVQVFGNEAASGGAMEVLNFGTIDLEDCKIYDNVSTGIGGGVYINKVSYSTMKNVEIYNNQAQGGGGGGLSINVSALVKADNLTVYENSADGIGGGIYNRGRLELNNSLVRDNITTGNGGGIGTFKTSSIPLSTDAGLYVTNSTISGNRSVKGAGIYLHVGCEGYLTDVTVTDNKGEAEGSGIFSGGRTTLENVTVTGNSSLNERYAVYMDPALYDGMSYYTGKKVLEGKIIVKDNEGGDMFMDEGTAIAIPGPGLAEGSEIHLELDSGMLTQRVIGSYHYEGEGLKFVITAGNRSITQPMEPEKQVEETQPTEGTEASQEQVETESNTGLYVGIGAISAVVIIAAAVLILVKKKNGKNAGKE